jgi:hypothetical protein
MKALFGEDPALCPLASLDSLTEPNEMEPFTGESDANEEDELNDNYVPISDSSSPEVTTTPIIFDHPAISQMPCDLTITLPSITLTPPTNLYIEPFSKNDS